MTKYFLRAQAIQTVAELHAARNDKPVDQMILQIKRMTNDQLIAELAQVYDEDEIKIYRAYRLNGLR